MFLKDIDFVYCFIYYSSLVIGKKQSIIDKGFLITLCTSLYWYPKTCVGKDVLPVDPDVPRCLSPGFWGASFGSGQADLFHEHWHIVCLLDGRSAFVKVG